IIAHSIYSLPSIVTLPRTTLFPYTTLFRSRKQPVKAFEEDSYYQDGAIAVFDANGDGLPDIYIASGGYHEFKPDDEKLQHRLYRSEEHTSELQSRENLVCRLLLEKKKKKT